MTVTLPLAPVKAPPSLSVRLLPITRMLPVVSLALVRVKSLKPFLSKLTEPLIFPAKVLPA